MERGQFGSHLNYGTVSEGNRELGTTTSVERMFGCFYLLINSTASRNCARNELGVMPTCCNQQITELEGGMYSNFVKFAGALFLALAGGVIGSIFTYYIEKDEYGISVTSCSEKGPEKVFLKNLETGYRVQIPSSGVPIALERITNVVNTGSKNISDEDLFISIDNEVGTRIHQVTIFFGNVLDNHEIRSSPDGLLHRIKLKNFNPNDRLSVLVTSERTVGITVNSKGNGYTTSTEVGRQDTCSMFSDRSYGGKIVFSKLDEGCTLNPQNLSLNCTTTHGYTIPKDFPPGRAILQFE